jgi:hypothetical protein
MRRWFPGTMLDRCIVVRPAFLATVFPFHNCFASDEFAVVDVAPKQDLQFDAEDVPLVVEIG